MEHTTVGTLDGAPMVKRWHHREKTVAAMEPSDGGNLEVTQTESPVPGEVTAGSDQGSDPFRMDIINGPNYPPARGFEMAGWRIVAVDSKLQSCLNIDGY